jgi:hypothetical protein
MRTIRQREVDAIMTQEWRDKGQGVLTWRDNKRRKMAFSVCGYVDLTKTWGVTLSHEDPWRIARTRI